MTRYQTDSNDSYSNFLFGNRPGCQKVATNYGNMFRALAKKYNKCHEEALRKVMTPTYHDTELLCTRNFRFRKGRNWKKQFSIPANAATVGNITSKCLLYTLKKLYKWMICFFINLLCYACKNIYMKYYCIFLCFIL